MIATTNGNDVYAGDGYVFVGSLSVAYPASGSGTGGGGGGGGGGACVCDHMRVYGERTSGESVPGDMFDCLDFPVSGLEKFTRELIGAEHALVSCVRITTMDGAVLDCSTSTPFDLPHGGIAYAPDMRGELVVTDRGVELVVSVEDIGMQMVSHNHFGGISYAAGADPSHRIYSHNASLKP